QFINPEADGAFSKVQGSHKKPHRDCCRMPPACNQSFEDCSLGGFPTEMKHLWIKLVSELDKLFLRHVLRFGLQAIADFQIIEVMLLHSADTLTTFVSIEQLV